MKCAHPSCHAVGPFGSRWYKGRQELVPYKLCERCRGRNAEQYKKFGDKKRTRNKDPVRRKREYELRKTEEANARRIASRREYANSEHGRSVIRKCGRAAADRINENPSLRLERALTASIRLRLAGVRHGESANIGSYTDFSSHEDLTGHFSREMKKYPGMTLENYGTFWSVAHKIPKVYFDFSDPEEIRRCNSKANLGCDYESQQNPLNIPSNSSKGSMIPPIKELYEIGVDYWPKRFGKEMNEEKRRRLQVRGRRVL
jgi:hypothetical protein